MRNIAYAAMAAMGPEADVEWLLFAAVVTFLDRWALGVAVRTVDATITIDWLEEFAAAFTFIEELACVRRHQFSLRVPAFWAGDC